MATRQGTSFNVRLILFAGRKAEPKGAAPLKDKDTDIKVSDYDSLYERVMTDMNIADTKEKNMRENLSEETAEEAGLSESDLDRPRLIIHQVGHLCLRLFACGGLCSVQMPLLFIQL